MFLCSSLHIYNYCIPNLLSLSFLFSDVDLGKISSCDFTTLLALIRIEFSASFNLICSTDEPNLIQNGSHHFFN